jgi:hypothetical protein
MNVAGAEEKWSEANQRYLVAEFARLKRCLGAKVDEVELNGDLQAACAALAAPAAIDALAELFRLSSFERDLLLLCAGAEMDAELARWCAAAQGQPQRRHATFGIALAALENSHWSALAAAGPLRRWRLVEVDETAGLVAGRLRIDERILHYLAGVNYLDPRLRPLLHAVAPPAVMAAAQREICDSLAALLHGSARPFPLVLLHGDDEDGQCDVAAAVAARLGLQLQRLYAEDLPANSVELDALATLWQREAVLLGTALLVQGRDGILSGAVTPFSERVGALLFIAGRELSSFKRVSLRFAVNKPRADEQKALWQEALGASGARLNGALDSVAAQFRLSAQRISVTGNSLRPALAAAPLDNELLWRACRDASRARLDDLAQRIEPAAGWDELVLPPAQKNILRQIAAQACHRLTVYQQWGFASKGARGLGLSALFAGESGTGKTMAAEVLAGALHLDLYRIDLAAVVSKYIGDTEKNLRRVFDAAEDSGAILLFDEADSLFGKRSEVRDSHDRYANIEVSYLLQRMEAYRGLAILTTNMKSALDVAFQRRLSFIVQFPFPDQNQRELIWRGVFPKATPLENIDYGKLARLNVSGGNIRNIALNAAFLAADDGTPVRMKHLLQAAHGEAAKRERPLSDAETRGWAL